MDLTEILKDCPKGTELYSRFLGSVEFCKITLDNDIEVIDGSGYHVRFKPNGTYKYAKNTEIDLFPSKDQRDWSKWHRPVVDGEVVMCGEDQFAIFKQHIKHLENGGELIRYYVYYDAGECDLDTIDGQCWMQRLATEEEKATLFQAIKDKGYKWNNKTKTLEKLIEPKFKVGDRIRKKGDYICGIIKCIDIDNFYSVEYSSGSVSFVNVKYQNEYELAPNKFDPKTLQPFDKVLGKLIGLDTWHSDFYSHYDIDSKYPYMCISRGYKEIIPYNDDTKHLVGKSDKAPEKYINW